MKAKVCHVFVECMSVSPCESELQRVGRSRAAPGKMARVGVVFHPKTRVACDHEDRLCFAFRIGLIDRGAASISKQRGSGWFS